MKFARSGTLIAILAIAQNCALAQVAKEPDYAWIRGGPGRSLSSAVSPIDGRFILTAGGGPIRIWRPSDGELLRSIASPPGMGAVDLAITPNGELLVSGDASLGGSILVWDVPNEEIVRIVPIDPSGYLGPVAISPDGSLIAATMYLGDTGPDVMLWRVSDSQLLGSWDWLGYGTVLAFSPNGRFLVVANLSSVEDAYYRLRMISLENGNLRWSRDPSNHVTSIDFSPDGAMIALGYQNNGGVRLISAADGATIRLLGGNQYHSSGVAFSAAGNLIAASDSDTTRVWSVADGVLQRELPTAAKQVIFSGDGERLYALGNEDAASAWRVSDGAQLFTFAESINSESVSMVPSGESVVIGLSGPNQLLELWRSADAEVTWARTAHLAGAFVDVSPDGEWIALGENYGNTFSLRRVEDGSAVWSRGQIRSMRQVAFSPDGSEIAVAHSQLATLTDAVEIFDTKTGDRLRAFGTDAQSISFAPHGGLLAVDLQYGPVQIWRWTDGTLLHVLGDDYEHGPLAMAPNASLLFCHYWNAEALRLEGHIWSVADGQLVGALDLSAYRASVAKFLGRDEILMLSGYAQNSYWNGPTRTLLRVENRNIGSSFRSLSISDRDSRLIIGSTWDGILALRNPCHPAHGDLDADCQTGLSDLAILLASFGTCTGDPAYNPIADIAESGCIDAADLVALLANFGT